jgi:hypothetical protein
VPGSLEAALVFVVLVVPGYLAVSGYRLGRASPPQPEGLAGAARAVTASAIVVLIAWRLGGQSVYEHALAGTALRSDEELTYRLALGVLVVPPATGFLLGELTDVLAGRVTVALGRLEERDEQTLQRRDRPFLWALRKVRARVPLDGPSIWDLIWKTLKRDEPFVYVRVNTTSGQSVMGTMGQASRAALSPQPRDLYIEQVLRPVRSPEGKVEFAPTRAGRGMFIAGEQIELVEWISQEGLKEVGADGRQQ